MRDSEAVQDGLPLVEPGGGGGEGHQLLEQAHLRSLPRNPIPRNQMNKLQNHVYGLPESKG